MMAMLFRQDASPPDRWCKECRPPWKLFVCCHHATQLQQSVFGQVVARDWTACYLRFVSDLVLITAAALLRLIMDHQDTS
jgi:hypothetical protein